MTTPMQGQIQTPAGTPMKFLSLFSGIGGLDLGLERAGMKCVAQVEIDPFCRRVLAKHWPDVPRFEDVRTITREQLPEGIDLIAGGFPCQDISNAGKRVGIDGERSGLWSEFFRLICEIRPRLVLVENVSALLCRGLDRVLGDLASVGFDSEWESLPAYSFGALHFRCRVFVVASDRKSESLPDADSLGCGNTFERQQTIPVFVGLPAREAFKRPTQPPILGVADGLPDWVDANRGLGNAVVPQVAEFIGRRIIAAVESLSEPLKPVANVELQAAMPGGKR